VAEDVAVEMHDGAVEKPIAPFVLS
jgi:hypothetical protein